MSADGVPVAPGSGRSYAGVRTVRHGIDGRVAELAMDRPEVLNAISTTQATSIAAAVADLAAEPGVRAVVLTSACGRAFCVGADLKERAGFTAADFERQRPVMRRAFGALRELPVPSVAAVHGYALGGGFELALACDLIVADETAVFGLPEVSVGLVPGGGGTQELVRRLGRSRAADLVLTARRVDCAEGDRLGFVDRRVGAGGDRDEALALADRIAANSPVGVRYAKRALRHGADRDLAAGLEVEDRCWRAAAFSRDRAEGIAAFNEKRAPDWTGG